MARPVFRTRAGPAPVEHLGWQHQSLLGRVDPRRVDTHLWWSGFIAGCFAAAVLFALLTGVLYVTA